MTIIIRDSVILLDSFSYLYRAYYADSNLKNNIDQQPRNVIYSMFNMLQRLIKKYNPTHIAIIFDSKGINFRKKIFKNYKDNRQPMPKNLKIQIDILYQIFKYIGVNVFMIDDVEADDIIGTLAVELEIQNKKVLINTNDKDMSQLVTSNVSIVDIATNYIYGPVEIYQKYGVPPKLMIDYFALVGDRSDNIPGVLGIGKKTAQILIQNLGGINSIYNNLDKISKISFRGSKNISKKLLKNKDLAFISYKLATIKTNIKINKNFNCLNVNVVKLKEFFKDYNNYYLNNIISQIQNNNFDT